MSDPRRIRAPENVVHRHADESAFIAFITPNMTNDAHDTNVTFAGQWLRSFLPPLLNNSYFMEDTLILVTFDENEEYTIPNRKQLRHSS